MKAFKIIFLLSFFASIFSCKTYETDETFPNGGDVKFVNLAINSYPTTFEVRKEDLAFITTKYGSFSKYYRISTGNHTFNIYSVSDDSKSKVLSYDDEISLNKSATYFLINNGATNDLSYIKAIDDVATPEYGKTRIRFVNAASNIGANVDVYNGTELLFSNMENYKVTDFITLDSAAGLNLKIYKTGVSTGTPLKSVNFSLKSMGVTTFALTGVYQATDEQPPLSVISNSNTQ